MCHYVLTQKAGTYIEQFLIFRCKVSQRVFLEHLDTPLFLLFSFCCCRGSSLLCCFIVKLIVPYILQQQYVCAYALANTSPLPNSVIAIWQALPSAWLLASCCWQTGLLTVHMPLPSLHLALFTQQPMASKLESCDIDRVLRERRTHQMPNFIPVFCATLSGKVAWKLCKASSRTLPLVRCALRSRLFLNSSKPAQTEGCRLGMQALRTWRHRKDVGPTSSCAMILASAVWLR